MSDSLDIEKYCEVLEANDAEIFRILHDLISNLPGISSKERYKIPFYFGKSWICYINKVKKGGTELAFTRANELHNVSSFLNFKDRKQIGGMEFHSPKDVNRDEVMAVLLSAIDLDDTVPYSHPKNKK